MRINLQYKITILITALVAILLAGVYFYLNHFLSRYTFERIRVNLVSHIKIVNIYFQSVHSNTPLTSDHMDPLADMVGKNLGMRVTIMTRDGTVTGDSEIELKDMKGVENHLYRPEVQGALKNNLGESRRFSTTLRQDLLYVAQMLGGRDGDGIIRLAIPLSGIKEVSDNLRHFLILVFILAFIISVGLGTIVAMLTARPIKEMSQLAKDVAGGNFERKIGIATNDEIGDLAESINFMSEQIRLRIEEVTLAKSRLEAVLLSMFEGMMVVNEEGVILLMNQRLRDFLHVTQEPVGRKPLEIIRNIEIQDLTDIVLLLEKGVESREISVHLPEEKALQIHATPVLRNGRTEGAVLVFHDITELRRLEKVRQDFVANVSHELRTPLTSIKGYAETLLEGALEDKKNARDFIEIIYNDADRLANLVNDLLDLARIESGKLDLDLKAQSLDVIVHRVLGALKNAAKNKAIHLVENLPSSLPKVKADEAAIAQILLNLVDNAIKYNKLSGRIEISAEEAGDLVKISVKDTGIGIPEEDLPRIFERFYRVDKARSRELGGTGLGLSIVKHIVAAHHGEVSVQSTVDEGSTFTISLPKA